MKNKVLGIIAVGATAVSSIILSAPAQAVKQDVDVNVTVDEVLFLRTFDTVELRVTQGELSNSLESDVRGTTDGTNQLEVSDVTINGESDNAEVIKNINELYAVYGNADADDINVRITVDPDANELEHEEDDDFTAIMTVEDQAFNSEVRNVDDIDIENGAEPVLIGGARLKFEFKEDGEAEAPKAGRYTGGKVIVEAISVGSFDQNNGG